VPVHHGAATNLCLLLSSAQTCVLVIIEAFCEREAVPLPSDKRQPDHASLPPWPRLCELSMHDATNGSCCHGKNIDNINLPMLGWSSSSVLCCARRCHFGTQTTRLAQTRSTTTTDFWMKGCIDALHSCLCAVCVSDRPYSFREQWHASTSQYSDVISTVMRISLRFTLRLTCQVHDMGLRVVLPCIVS
jgi:hypothetical protein